MVVVVNLRLVELGNKVMVWLGSWHALRIPGMSMFWRRVGCK